MESPLKSFSQPFKDFLTLESQLFLRLHSVETSNAPRCNKNYDYAHVSSFSPLAMLQSLANL